VEQNLIQIPFLFKSERSGKATTKVHQRPLSTHFMPKLFDNKDVSLQMFFHLLKRLLTTLRHCVSP